MEVVVVKKQEKTQVFVDGKIVGGNQSKVYIFGNIYNLDDFTGDGARKYIKDSLKVLHIYQEKGLEPFTKFSGEFAIIMVVNNEVILLRDRIGTKQVYYTQIDDTFICSNNLKYIMKNYKEKLTIDKKSLASYLCYSYINEPYTIFKNVNKLECGTIMKISQNIEKQKYYDLREEYRENHDTIIWGDTIVDEDITRRQLRDILDNSIRLRSKKQNVGIFLSAGIDSTLITALLRYRTRNITTYTIGFHEKERNEADKTQAISKLWHTRHFEYYIDGRDALKIAHEIPRIYTEPLADPSIIPTICLFNLVHDDVDVILTGDGADQMFFGSNVYDDVLTYDTTRKILSNLKLAFKREIPFSQLITTIYCPNYQTARNLYHVKPRKYYNNDIVCQPNYMLFDLTTFLPNRLFAKMSNPSSTNNVNIAHPFVDNDMISYSLKLHSDFKYYKNEKKYILKRMLYKEIPEHMLNDKKCGFGIPLDKWIYDYYEKEIINLSNPEALKKQKLFSYRKVNKMLKKLKNKTLDNKEIRVLFYYYVFQLWYKEYIADLW